jgi:hypothetical protein
MTTIVRKRGEFDDLVFSVDLSDYGKTSTDIEDIFFSVKVLETDADDGIFFKTYLTSGITFTGTTQLEVNVLWGNLEYDNFVINKMYIAGMFIKFSGDPVADEHVNTTFNLKVTQDFLQQN